METRANYILIGAFALAGFLGILAFFLWFANLQLDRQFAYYDVDFESVSGLSEASDVRFVGLPVGQVVDVRLSPESNGRVRVRLEIDADTPVRTDSLATIESQGVTGVSFVGITAGTSGAPLLADVSSDDVPRIEAGRSTLQSLSQDAPAILEETLGVVRELRQLIGGENQQRIEAILVNIEGASESFAAALEDFSGVSDTVSTFALQIDRFNTTLDTLTADAGNALNAVQSAVESVDGLTDDARRALTQGTLTLEQAETTISTADRYIVERLGPATEQLNQSIAAIDSRLAALSESGTELMATFSETGRTATARLSEAEATLTATNALIASIDDTLGSVDSAARRIDGVIEDSAAPLLEELRTATAEATSVISSIGDAAEEDLPAILAEIRSATETASGVVASVGEDLSSASGRIDALVDSAGATLESVRITFSNANETLSAINAALETGQGALTAAEQAFIGADRVVNEDAAAIAEQLRATLSELEVAVGAVATEIPGVAEDVRSASRSAEAAFAQIAGTVDRSAPAFNEFAATALPQFGRLAAESRALVNNLNALADSIRRDPRRFFLDPRAPEFSR